MKRKRCAGELIRRVTGKSVGANIQEMLAYMTGLAVAASLKAPWQHGRRQLGAGGLKLPVLVFR